MDEVARALLWTFDVDLWTYSAYPHKGFGFTRKGEKVYLCPAAEVSRLKELIALALNDESPEQLHNFRFDPPALPPNLSVPSATTVLIPASVYNTFLQKYATRPLPFGWVTWNAAAIPSVILEKIEIRLMEIVDGQADEEKIVVFEENEPMDVFIEILSEQLQVSIISSSQVQERRFWNITKDFNKEELLIRLRQGEKLKRQDNTALLEASQEPMLQVLRSLVVVVEVLTRKKLRAMLKEVNPFHAPLPKSTPVGLRNLGNSCYLNCVLQCIGHLPDLLPYYLHTPFAAEQKPLNYHLSSLIWNMYNSGAKALDPDQFYCALMEAVPKYRDSEQQDSEEFFLNLIRSLIKEESWERSAEVSTLLLKSYPGPSTLIDILCREASPLAQVFTGVLRTEVKCCNCGELGKSWDPYISLPLVLCPSRRYLINMVCIDPAAPPIRFSIDSPTPYEENESLLAIRQVITEIKGLSHFEIGELDSGFFNGPVGLTNMPNSNTLWVMQLPEYRENQIHLFCNFMIQGKVLGTRTLVCDRNDLIQDVKMLVAKYLVSAGVARFINGGIMSKVKYAPVDESDIVEITESADIGFILNSQPLNVEHIEQELSIQTLGELAELCDGVLKATAVFPSLPKVCEEAFRKFKQEKPVSLPKYREKDVTLTLIQLIEYTLREKPQNEEDSFRCEVCQEATQHVVGTHIELFPKLLALPIQLARLEDGRVRKSMIRVCFPLTGLDLSKFEKGPAYTKPMYDLQAVVCHKGKETTSGHYFAYAKDPVRSCWCQYNDEHCKEVSEREVEEAQGAYLFFYRRR